MAKDGERPVTDCDKYVACGQCENEYPVSAMFEWAGCYMWMFQFVVKKYAMGSVIGLVL